MHGPPSWQIVVRDLWCLPESDANAFWHALSQSTYSRPMAMRQRFALAGYAHITTRFWQDFCSPPAVMAVLEALAHEGRLSRHRASRIEASLLREVNQHGQWRGDAWDGVERVQTPAPDILTWAETGT